jgi:hypothetical protein
LACEITKVERRTVSSIRIGVAPGPLAQPSWTRVSGKSQAILKPKAGGAGAAEVAEDLVSEGQDGYVDTYGNAVIANRKAGLGYVAHHVPQAALGIVSREDGITITPSRRLHSLTRTFGGRAIVGLMNRQHLAADIWDLRGILRQAGWKTSKLNRQLADVIERNLRLGSFDK